VAKNATMARRADLYELHRAQILLANGIDPNKGGEFKCSRCKSSKTTFHEKQTRSADEPMTVFVLCLNCGKRWRC
jgi:transcription elongation factor S-II